MQKPAPLPLTRDDLERMVDVWKKRLYLTHWQTTVEWEKKIDNLAECERYDVYDYAALKFAEDWPTWDRRKANLTVVHELLHMTTRALEWATLSAEKVLPKAAFLLFEARFRDENEALIDRLATILVELGGEV